MICWVLHEQYDNEVQKRDSSNKPLRGYLLGGQEVQHAFKP